MRQTTRGEFREPIFADRARVLPWTSVMAGSLVTILPAGAPLPLLPPFGLLLLLSWRLLAPLAVRVWVPPLLGLFDDLVSGQPVGSAMLLWPCAYFLVDALEARSGIADFWQNWAMAAVAITLVLAIGRLLATPMGAHVDTALMVQIAVTVLLFPLTAYGVAWIDARLER